MGDDRGEGSVGEVQELSSSSEAEREQKEERKRANISRYQEWRRMVGHYLVIQVLLLLLSSSNMLHCHIKPPRPAPHP